MSDNATYQALRKSIVLLFACRATECRRRWRRLFHNQHCFNGVSSRPGRGGDGYGIKALWPSVHMLPSRKKKEVHDRATRLIDF